MGFFDTIRNLFRGEVATKSEVEQVVSLVKALDAKEEAARQKASSRPRAIHLPLDPQPLEPGGRGPRKMLGYLPEVLRAFARTNPMLRSAIDVRKREISEAIWDIIPDLDLQDKELDMLRRLVQSARRFEDRTSLLDNYTSPNLDPKMVKDLIDATKNPGLTSPEVRYRFTLAMDDLTREALKHVAKVKPLFENPNPSYTWRDILRAIVPDLLILDAACIELVRAQYPLDPAMRAAGYMVPKPDNEILQLHWVDGATVRPVIDKHGMLAGLHDPHEVAYEQWIDNRRVEGGGWKRHEMLRMVENPTTDVVFRGYGFSRVETLIMTTTLDAMSDNADKEEYMREFYGGFLNIGDDSVQQEDLEALRFMIESELEGTRKLPLLAFKDVNYVPTSSDSNNRDKRSMERRKLYMQRMCAIFEIPPVKLGHFENANYNTSETSKELGDDGLRNLQGFLDRKITDSIVRSFGFKDIKYASNPSHLRDEPQRLDAAKQKLDLGIWEVNDARLAFGKEPSDEGQYPLVYFTEFFRAKGMNEGAGGNEEGEDALNTEGDGEFVEEGSEQGMLEEGEALGQAEPDGEREGSQVPPQEDENSQAQDKESKPSEEEEEFAVRKALHLDNWPDLWEV